MASRRHVLLGLAGAIGRSQTTEGSDKSQRRKKAAYKRVRWCYGHTYGVCGCDALPSLTCRGCMSSAGATCCAKAKKGWGPVYQCLNS